MTKRNEDMLKQAEAWLAEAEKHPASEVLKSLYKPGMSQAEYRAAGIAACKSDAELQEFALEWLTTQLIAEVCREELGMAAA